jgi:hypothetical protein
VRTVLAAVCAAALLAATQPGPDFRDIGKQAGLTQSFPNGGDKSKEYIIETTGSGVAFIDYDNDGYLDIFVLSGDGGTNRMYHNDHNGHFTDVTAELGLTSSGWAEGVCAGDYDNDGYTDLFVTYWGQNRLYRNVGGKRFEDVTAKAHLTQDRVRYNTGCAFLDYDGDGHLDLFVANYLKFDFATTPKAGSNPYCFYRGMAVNCGPAGSRSTPTCCTTTRAMGPSKTSRSAPGSRRRTATTRSPSWPRRQRRRAAGHLRGGGSDGRDALHQPGRRHLLGRGRHAWRGVRRERPRAVRHGAHLGGL